MNPEELKQKVDILREYCKSSKDNFSTFNDINKGNKTLISSTEHIRKKSNQGNLAKIGLTLLAFPFPIIIDDLLGWPFLIAGLVQKKIKNSALYVEDPQKSFSLLQKELNNIQQEKL